jgi:hypothetical protein
LRAHMQPARKKKKPAVQFRVSREEYEHIAEEASALGLSMAEFAREAVLGRTILKADARGRPWTRMGETGAALARGRFRRAA